MAKLISVFRPNIRHFYWSCFGWPLEIRRSFLNNLLNQWRSKMSAVSNSWMTNLYSIGHIHNVLRDLSFVSTFIAGLKAAIKVRHRCAYWVFVEFVHRTRLQNELFVEELRQEAPQPRLEGLLSLDVCDHPAHEVRLLKFHDPELIFSRVCSNRLYRLGP